MSVGAANGGIESPVHERGLIDLADRNLGLDILEFGG
jgi:hypothetical protein